MMWTYSEYFFRCIVYSKLNSEKISACIWYCWISSEYSVGTPHWIFVTIRSMLWWLSASWHAHTGGRTSWISYHCHQGCRMHPRLPGIRDAGIIDEFSTSGFIIVIYAGWYIVNISHYCHQRWIPTKLSGLRSAVDKFGKFCKLDTH